MLCLCTFCSAERTQTKTNLSQCGSFDKEAQIKRTFSEIHFLTPLVRYLRNGVHLEYKPDARRAHDGTVEYASRDAHIGAHSRRSDLEILGYNLVHWMSGTLPWMDNLKDPK